VRRSLRTICGPEETFTLPDVLGVGTSQVLGAADVAGNCSG
jgi:hypothetical protein